MMESNKNKAPFDPMHFYCACDKKEVLFSRYPGEFRQCSCMGCAVDQTEWYTRFIGSYLKPVEEERT